MTDFTSVMNYLDQTKSEVIRMLDLDQIERERQLIEDAINSDGDAPLHKLIGDDPLDSAWLERLKAKQRADELLAKNRDDKAGARSDNTRAAMQRVSDFVWNLVRESEEFRKDFERRQAAREAEEDWRQTHPPGSGPYSDAPVFRPASKYRLN
jgi:hypothetical protein